MAIVKATSSNEYVVLSGGGKDRDMFKIVSYTFSTGTPSAGAKGYIQASMTIPGGYTSFGAQIDSSQIANLGGAQFTPIYNHIGTTGSQTIYVLYYYPTAITPSRTINIKLFCIKTEYFNEV